MMWYLYNNCLLYIKYTTESAFVLTVPKHTSWIFNLSNSNISLCTIHTLVYISDIDELYTVRKISNVTTKKQKK